MIPAFHELTGSEKAIEVLRWLAVLPVAVIAGVAAHLLAIIGNSPGCTRGLINPDESVLDRCFVVLVSNVAMGAVIVIAGAKTAPRYKQVVAIVLAVVWIFFSGMVFTVLLQRPAQFWDYMAVVVGAIAAVGGAAYIYTEQAMSKPQEGGQS